MSQYVFPYSFPVILGDQPPTANDDAYFTDEDITLNVVAPGVLINDVDPVPGPQPLTAVKVTDPSHGNLTLNTDGSFQYVPNANWNGVDSFTYQCYDGAQYSNIATVVITVHPINDAPTAYPDSYIMDDFPATTTIPAPGVLFNDTDPEGDGLTTDLVTTTPHGTLVLNADGSFDYTPDDGTIVFDEFVYRCYDGDKYSGPAIVKLKVGANKIPHAASDNYNGFEDTTLNVGPPGVLDNDTDADSWPDPLTSYKTTDPSHGTLTLDLDGSFTYVPELNWSGVDTFTYRCFDGMDWSPVAIVTLTIASVQDNPVAVNDEYETHANTVLTVATPGVLINDSDVDLGDTLTAEKQTDPTHGTLNYFNADGSFQYIPDTDYHGADSFTYKAKDNHGNYSNIATVTFNIFSKDLNIYYRLDAAPPGDEVHLNCWCNGWNRNDYELTIETTLNATERDLLFDNIYPGAVTELFDCLGEKHFVDTTWQDKNTLYLEPVNTFHLDNMYRDTKIGVKSISFERINRWNWAVKIIGVILWEDLT